MRNATDCGNSSEQGEEEKKAGDTSKAEDRKNGVSEVRSVMWKCKKELTMWEEQRERVVERKAKGKYKKRQGRRDAQKCVQCSKCCS